MSNSMDSLDKILQHLNEWSKQHRENERTAKEVKDIEAGFQWLRKVREEWPSEVVPPDLSDSLRKQYDHLTGVIQPLPQIVFTDVTSTAGVSIAGLSAVNSQISSLSDHDSLPVRQFSIRFTGEYTQLRESQERPKKVRDLLTNLNDKSLIERFDRALKAFSATRTGTTERTAASLEMRTLLDGLKGYLWKTARRHDRENMKWELVAERLAKGMVGGYEWQTLIEQESKYTQLFDTLSAVGKDRTSITQERLDLLWGQLLDHIQVVLTMIKT